MNNFQESLSVISDFFARNKLIFAGRGPSDHLHLGHIIIIELLNKNNSNLFFQISDDEKMYRDNSDIASLEQYYNVYSKIFNRPNAEIFINSQNIEKLYSLLFTYGDIKLSKILKIFGFTEASKLGEINYALIQAITPVYISEKYNISEIGILTGEDQKPFFESLFKQLNLNIKLNMCYIPTLIGLNGEKMSSSKNNTIKYIDSKEEIEKKIKKSMSAGHSLNEIPSAEKLKKDFCYNVGNFLLLGKEDLNLKNTLIDYEKGKVNIINFKRIINNKLFIFLQNFKDKYNL